MTLRFFLFRGLAFFFFCTLCRLRADDLTQFLFFPTKAFSSGIKSLVPFPPKVFSGEYYPLILRRHRFASLLAPSFPSLFFPYNFQRLFLPAAK